MIVAHLSDTHLSARSAAGPRRLDELRRTIAAINALTPAPDLVIHTGDVTHSGQRADYEAAAAALATLRMPVRATLGNRDRREPFVNGLDGVALPPLGGPFVQYAFEHGGVRFVAGDTYSSTVGLGETCAGRLTELEGLLSKAPVMPTVVFLHHPPVDLPTDFGSCHFGERGDALALARLIARHPQVVHVLAGHVHRACVVALGSATLTTPPSLATDLRRERGAAAPERHPVFHLHRFAADGSISASIAVSV